jgi:hypothetical protein
VVLDLQVVVDAFRKPEGGHGRCPDVVEWVLWAG